VTLENSMKSTVACWWLGNAAYALQLLDWLFTGGYAFDETSLLPQTYCTFLYVGTAHQEMRVAAGDDKSLICRYPTEHLQGPGFTYATTRMLIYKDPACAQTLPEQGWNMYKGDVFPIPNQV
jgi:hypothetical protein